MADVITHVKF